MIRKRQNRVIAFYLPQFHPIPENDQWWGKGFTEWTNVGKAKALFKNHYQPRVPADLGYYDLRVSEVRQQQAEMARYAGVEGFAYWHYWFAGKRLIERPFNEVLQLGEPNFPFCLAWANETWSGVWHGKANKILMEQTYPGIRDYEKHFYSNLNAFRDPRYIKVDNKPLFYVYKPFQIPDTKIFLECWQELAIKNGLDGIFFVAHVADLIQRDRAIKLGYDSVNLNGLKEALMKQSKVHHFWNKFSEVLFKGNFNLPIFDYQKLFVDFHSDIILGEKDFPTIISGWDNSPRSGKKGRILINYNPDSFSKHVENVLSKCDLKDYEHNLIFLKSWNEWAEGNYVEPDLKYGWQYLDVLRKAVL